LARGLDEFIAQQSPEQWDTVPSWLKDQSKFDQTVEKKSPNEDTRTIKFTPQITTGSTNNWSVPLEAREWEIWGCAMFRYEGEDIKTQAMVVVRYYARKWHFSRFGLMSKQGRAAHACQAHIPLLRTRLPARLRRAESAAASGK
jgi:hypothetical protein